MQAGSGKKIFSDPGRIPVLHDDFTIFTKDIKLN
jgi:hypothetical protein